MNFGEFSNHVVWRYRGGERVGSDVGDGLAVAVALAVGEAPAVAVALPAIEHAAPAQLSTVTVYCLS